MSSWAERSGVERSPNINTADNGYTTRRFFDFTSFRSE